MVELVYDIFISISSK